jgi:hypothetical protein
MYFSLVLDCGVLGIEFGREGKIQMHHLILFLDCSYPLDLESDMHV